MGQVIFYNFRPQCTDSPDHITLMLERWQLVNDREDALRAGDHATADRLERKLQHNFELADMARERMERG